MGPPEDMTVRILKEVLDELNVTYNANEKKADLIDKVRHVRAALQEESYHNSEKANVFPSSEHTDTKRDNCFHFKTSPGVCLYCSTKSACYISSTTYYFFWKLSEYTWKFSFSSK